VGAGITYYRRYALAGMLGIAPDEDIDANDDPAPASVSSTSKPMMSNANYKSILMSAKAKQKEKKTWKQIQALISDNFVLDMGLLQKLEKELYG
jgi:hypothetical protein